MLRRAALLVLMAALIPACGFSLRSTDQVQLPVERLIVSHPEGIYPLRRYVLDALAASNVTVVDANSTDYELRLSAEQIERRAVSFNTRAGAGQYEVTLQIEAALLLNNQQLGESVSIDVSGNFYEDTANISGSNSGLSLLMEDLRLEMANQIIQRLQRVEL